MLIIGDIHGCYLELIDLVERAGLGADDLVVSVGDLVDRGPEPGQVIDFFRARAARFVLMGNHERKHVRAVPSYSQQVTQAQLGDRYAADVAWMATLPYHLETDEVRVVHFGHYPGTPLDEVPEDVRAGTTSGEQRLRERYGARPWWDFYDDDKPIAFGHHVVGPEPLVVKGRVFGLDTGACHGGRLTGLLVPELRIVSVPAREDHWKRVRAAWQVPVLRTLPWATMTFEQIDRKLGRLRDPEMGDEVLDQIAGWVATLRDAVPDLRRRLEDEAERLGGDGRALAAHPAGSWLNRWRAGRLSATHLGCSGPEHLVKLAAALGVTLPASPL